jgi:prevent-host-death family protein
MRDTYSLYEAKTKLSEIVRKVREGRHVTVTLRGEPVMEMRPIAKPKSDFEAHIQELTRRGAIVPAKSKSSAIRPIAKRPGALKRFLDERD